MSEQFSSDWKSTRWSRIIRIQSGSDLAERDLSDLLEICWKPMCAFLLRKGVPKQEVLDVVQGFAAELLDPDSNWRNRVFDKAAENSCHRFRSFLLTSLQDYHKKQLEMNRAQKRGGGQNILSLNQEFDDWLQTIEPADNETPEDVYEREWAKTFLDEAWRRLGVEYCGRKNDRTFEVCRQALSQRKSVSNAECAAQLEISVATFKVRLNRFKIRFRAVLESLTRETLDDPSGVTDEIRHLFSVLGQNSRNNH